MPSFIVVVNIIFLKHQNLLHAQQAQQFPIHLREHIRRGPFLGKSDNLCPRFSFLTKTFRWWGRQGQRRSREDKRTSQRSQALKLHCCHLLLVLRQCCIMLSVLTKTLHYLADTIGTTVFFLKCSFLELQIYSAGWSRPPWRANSDPRVVRLTPLSIHPYLHPYFTVFRQCNYFFFQITAPVMFLPGSGDVRNIKKSSPAVAAAVPQNHFPHQQQEGNLLPPATQCLCLARLHLRAPRVCFKWRPNEIIIKPTQQSVNFV